MNAVLSAKVSNPLQNVNFRCHEAKHKAKSTKWQEHRVEQSDIIGILSLLIF